MCRTMLRLKNITPGYHNVWLILGEDDPRTGTQIPIEGNEIYRWMAMPIEKYRSYHGGEVYLEYQDRTIKVMKAELK